MITTKSLPALHKNFISRILLLVLIIIISGCAAPKRPTPVVFFPPPPNEPHVQYLTGYSSSTDIEDPPSNFSLVLTGKETRGVVKHIGKTYGVRVHDGKIYLCGSASGVLIILDPAAKSMSYFEGSGLGQMKGPVNLTFDDEGFMYVADPPRKEIVVFSPEGMFVRSFGKDIPNSRITDVAIYEGKLYALDSKAGLVRVFNRRTGVETASFGQGEEPTKNLAIPTNFAFDPNGNLFITNVGHAKVIKMDRDGHFLASYGRIGDSFGEFARPKGIAIDEKGWTFVVDNGHANVQMFNENMKLLTFFGNTPTEVGTLNLPTGIAVSKENLKFYQQFAAPGFVLEEVIFVVNQYGKPKVSVFGLGQMTKWQSPIPAPAPAEPKK